MGADVPAVPIVSRRDIGHGCLDRKVCGQVRRKRSEVECEQAQAHAGANALPGSAAAVHREYISIPNIPEVSFICGNHADALPSNKAVSSGLRSLWRPRSKKGPLHSSALLQAARNWKKEYLRWPRMASLSDVRATKFMEYDQQL